MFERDAIIVKGKKGTNAKMNNDDKGKFADTAEDKIGANKITSVKEKKGTNVKMNNDNNFNILEFRRICGFYSAPKMKKNSAINKYVY